MGAGVGLPRRAPDTPIFRSVVSNGDGQTTQAAAVPQDRWR